MKQLKIYLGDLDHFTKGNRISIPYGVGMMSSYLHSTFSSEIEVTIFKNPQELIDAINDCPPDVLGMSFYMWNEKITLKIIEYAKLCNKETITIIGGPSVGRTSPGYENILSKNPLLDIVALDTGEKTLLRVIEQILGFGSKNIFKESIAGCASRIINSEEIVRGDLIDQYIDFSLIPSPYLSGLLDKFLDKGYLPQLETNRGCPYSCTFCDYGADYRSKLNIRDENLVHAELDYMAVKSKSRELSITDANLGILGERDLRLAEKMLKMYQSGGFPYVTDYATAKVKTDIAVEVLKVMAKITGRIYFGLQTLTEVALENAKRKNMPFEQILQIGKGENLAMMVDLIYGLPGETSQTFLDTLSKLVDAGITAPSIYQLRILPGTAADTEERKKYKYETRFRPFNNRFGEYKTNGKDILKIVETEEILVANNFFNFEEFLNVRLYGLLSEVMLGYGNHRNTVAYLNSKKINVAKIIFKIIDECENYNYLKKYKTEYMTYTRNELFFDQQSIEIELTNDTKKWSDLLDLRGEYFKINLGFVGSAMLLNTSILLEIDQILRTFKSSLPDIDSHFELEHVLKIDNQHRLLIDTESSGTGINFSSNNLSLKEVVRYPQSYDDASWIAENFKNSLKEYFLKENSGRLREYKINEFTGLVKHLKELSNIKESYNFCERALLYAPDISLRRRPVNFNYEIAKLNNINDTDIPHMEKSGKGGQEQWNRLTFYK